MDLCTPASVMRACGPSRTAVLEKVAPSQQEVPIRAALQRRVMGRVILGQRLHGVLPTGGCRAEQGLRQTRCEGFAGGQLMGARMKQIGIVTLLSVFASAAAPGLPAYQSGATLLTSKSTEQFAGCFVEAQDRASLAWWFVPKADGGTFSNLGAKGVRSPYFLAVSDRGWSREVRFEGVNAASPVGRTVTRAVDQCV
jgi:hypothetical protein